MLVKQGDNKDKNNKITSTSIDDDLLFVIDKNNKILNYNRTFSLLFGENEENFNGSEITHFCSSELKEKCESYLKNLIRGAVTACIIPFQTNSGNLIPFEITTNQGIWQGEKAYYCLGRNTSANVLAEEHEFQIFNLIRTPLLIYSLQHHLCVGINKSFEDVLGYKNNEIIGRTIDDFDILQNPNELKSAKKLFKTDNSLVEFETFLIDKSGYANRYNISADSIHIHSSEYLLISASKSNITQETELRFQHQLDQQKLVADISQELSAVNFYSRLNHLLGMLGEHSGVSRVYIFEDAENGNVTNNTFEWCNEGIIPQISELQGIPYEIIPSWKKALISDGRVFSKNIEELPADIYAILEPQGIKSILIFPLYADEKFIGFIGFDECSRNKVWLSDELDLLKLISNLLSNAFDRQLMLQRIKEKQIRLELAVGNAHEGIWDWDITTNEMLFDTNWVSMLGYSQNELEFHYSTLEKLLHPDDKERVVDQLNNHLAGNTEYFESSYRLLTNTGEWKWVLNKGKTIAFDDEKQPVKMIGKHTDLTEIKNNEEKLEAAIGKGKELNELKSRFIANASHEFRTPLASILLISEVLKQYWKQMDTTQIDSRIDKITDQATHLSGIINKVFEISKLQAGRTGFYPEAIDIVALCSSIVNGFNLRSDVNNRITFHSALETYTLLADRGLLVQALNNLISNAVKYSPNDSFISVRFRQNENEIQIQVKDNGIGIPAPEIKHLFQPFFRASNTNNIPGNGLGLSIAQESIALHRGQIKVCSKVNKSTTFIVCLPKNNSN